MFDNNIKAVYFNNIKIILNSHVILIILFRICSENMLLDNIIKYNMKACLLNKLYYYNIETFIFIILKLY